MSLILHDPFFDGFEDIVSSQWPFSLTRSYPFSHDNSKEQDAPLAKKVRRDVITPFSGFGRMDMQEKEKDYELCVDIPGMKKEEIKISTENNMLVIEGERKKELCKDDEQNKYHFMERHYGSFHREVTIPVNANAESICATYENGVLKVCIPKVEQPIHKKQITVK